MNQEYVCPYCRQNSYAKTSKKSGKFNNWGAVSMHTSRCKLNNNSYIICPIYGPLLIADLELLGINNIKKIYPKLALKYKFKKAKINGMCSTDFSNSYTKDSLIKDIQKFYKEFHKIPSTRDFKYNSEYPSPDTIIYHFGTWNFAIETAGFTPNIQNGFGINTYGLDKHLYRSKAEAYFADNYLFNKYEYVIEPSYPAPHNKYYDWYVKDLGLYIELDGGCRPAITIEKIAINKALDRKCVIVNTDSIYDSNYVIEVLANTQTKVKSLLLQSCESVILYV